MLSRVFKHIKNEKGMSLLELVISIGILTIIIIPLTNTMLTAARVNANSQEMMIASQEAQKIIEQEKVGLPNSNTNQGYASQVTLGQAYDSYIIEPTKTGYSAVITLDEQEEDNFLIYKNNHGVLTNIGQQDFQTGDGWWLQVYSNQLIFVKDLTSYIIAYDQTQPILSVENYGNKEFNLKVTNYTQDRCYVYTSQVGNQEGQTISITKGQGEVIVREVRKMKQRTPQANENMLRHIRVKVSTGTVYEEDDKRAEIHTLIKE